MGIRIIIKENHEGIKLWSSLNSLWRSLNFISYTKEAMENSASLGRFSSCSRLGALELEENRNLWEDSLWELLGVLRTWLSILGSVMKSKRADLGDNTKEELVNYGFSGFETLISGCLLGFPWAWAVHEAGASSGKHLLSVHLSSHLVKVLGVTGS